MMRKIFYLMIIFTFSGVICSKAGEKFNANTMVIDSLQEVGWSHIYNNPDSSVHYAKIMVRLSEDLDYKQGLWNALYLMGYAYDELSYFDKAAENYYKALELVKNNKLSNEARKTTFLLQCLGVTYQNTYGYNTALEFFNEGLKIASESNIKEAIADLNLNIGITYWKKGDNALALNYYNKAFEAFQDLKDAPNFAMLYNFIGLLQKADEKFELAAKSYLAAIEISENLNMPEKALYVSNLGENYFVQGHFDLAKKYYFEALDVSKSHNDISRMKWIYNNIGDVYNKESNYAEAIAYYEKSLTLSGDSNDEELQRSYKGIYIAYEGKKEFELASAYKSRYIDQTDKIIAMKEELNEQNAQYRMKELEWQREIMQKEVLLASAEKENVWGRIIIGIALMLILYCSRLIYLYYSKIAKARKIVNSYSVTHLNL